MPDPGPRAAPAVLPDPALEGVIVQAMRDAARDRILPRFRNLSAADIATKSGPSDLVTLADTEAEAQLSAAIRAAWPGAEVLGEEAVAADKSLRARMGQADWAVVIDPVDGTWNYAKGLSVFGMILAVLHHGRPVLSVIYDPVMDDWLIARPGQGARMAAPRGEGAALHTSSELRAGRMTGYVSLGLFPKPDRRRIVTEFPDFARVTSLRCAAHEYRMLAQGHVEFMLSGPTPHPWDHAAGVLAVTEAGGVARFLDGTDYTAARERGVLLAAASQAVWDEMAGRFAPLARPA